MLSMLEKITLSLVPSSVIHGRRWTEELLRDEETTLQDAVARVYGNRAKWFYQPEGERRQATYFGDDAAVHYEIKNDGGDTQVQVGVESTSLDLRATGTFLRTMLESHDVREKEGDAQAEFISQVITATGQAALARFHVRVASAVRYHNGQYQRIGLSGSAAPGH